MFSFRNVQFQTVQRQNDELVSRKEIISQLETDNKAFVAKEASLISKIEELQKVNGASQKFVSITFKVIWF